MYRGFSTLASWLTAWMTPMASRPGIKIPSPPAGVFLSDFL